MEDPEIIENNVQQEFCRLCDTETDENGEMFSVFDKNEEGQEIIDLIQECLRLAVVKSDPLSKYVCADCLINLNALFKFKKKSIEVAFKNKVNDVQTNGDNDVDKLQSFNSYELDGMDVQNCAEDSTDVPVVDEIFKIDAETSTEDEVFKMDAETSTDAELTKNGSEISKEDEITKIDCETSTEAEITGNDGETSKEAEMTENEDETSKEAEITENDGEAETTENDEITKIDVETSTEDITILCSNCRSEIVEAHKVDKEIELCTELHQAIADSFSRNKIITSDKILRSRRKRTQPFYHELDDSLCSSLTEFTNTESSQCFEFTSDIDSLGDDEDERPPKRRKLERECKIELPIPEISFEEKFEDEDEYRFNPLSLLQLCLNVINKEHIPEYEPDEFTAELVEPECSYCGKFYRNSKLLALHEITHMGIELGEKVDNPTLWHESRDDAVIRNKWLTSEDDVMEEENEIENDTMGSEAMELEADEEEEESLLIPVGSGEQRDGQNYEVTREVNLMDGKPYVDGLPLSDYPKEERRAFYHSMRIGGVNKRFCPLCRYSFKDNWAIESHYFSMACYYTCRYCGMRFNKQRNRYDEHVEEHVRNNDAYSTKVFAASKNNNIVPKVLYPKKRYARRENVELPLPQPIEVKNFVPLHKRTLQPEIKVKQEPGEFSTQLHQSPFGHGQSPQVPLQTSQSKTGNQAFFCRKCYKVFFKLDEFNVHSKNCDFNQFPNNQMLGNYVATPSKPSPAPSTPNNVSSEPILTSTSGRPIRNCAKEAGPYRDELYIPEHILKEQVQTSASQGPFICYICNSPFPTIYSRNSHMRIHKSENLRETPPSTSQSPQQRHRMNYQDINQYQKPSVAHFAQVKEEPLDLEPEVEIHEQAQESYSASLSPAVSITPIAKHPNQKPQINPNVMRLVQNNPHLSIKNREPFQQNLNQQMQQHLQQMLGGQADADRTYKCSSCWEAFANKSHLYFHKKNQCEGSKYPCPFCKKRFGTEAAYSSHIFYSHPE